MIQRICIPLQIDKLFDDMTLSALAHRDIRLDRIISTIPLEWPGMILDGYQVSEVPLFNLVIKAGNPIEFRCKRSRILLPARRKMSVQLRKKMKEFFGVCVMGYTYES